MKETKEDTVDLGGISASSLEMIIDFIYSGEMDLNLDCLIDILNTANHLQIQTALDLCSDYIISLLSFSNAEEFVHIADIYSLKKVSDFFTKKLLTNFEEFVDATVYLTTSAENLINYLNDDRLKVKSEFVLLDCITKWYKHDNTRSEHIISLLKCVRFGLVSKNVLLQSHPLLTLFPCSMPYVQQGLKYHNDAITGHPAINATCKVRSMVPSLVLVYHGSSPRPLDISAFDETSSSYYQLASDSNASRDCRVVEVNNFLYVFRVVDSGGGTFVNCLIRFDPRHLSLIALMPCRCLRIDPAIVSTDGKIYCFGGCIDIPQGSSGNTILDFVEVYNVKENTWNDVEPMPHPTHSHAVCVAKGLIYLSGGVTASSRNVASDNFFEFNPYTNQYSTKASMNGPRRLHEMETFGDHIYVLGGIGSHSFVQQQNQIPVERYSLDCNQWTLLSCTLAGRSIGHFTVYNKSILSLGREHHLATEDDIWSYSSESDSWSPFAKAPRRTSLASTSAILLHINFYDEKVSKRLLTDKW